MAWASAQRGATLQTRRAPPSYQPWTPLPYQLRAADFLVNHPRGALPLRPGGRKTSITLKAFCDLRAKGMAQAMLVIAPLRVCRMVWRQEAAKWEEFRDLKFSLLHGPKKDDRLLDDADIWLINPEGVDWLAAKYFGRNLPFDIVTIDELTKFKNASAERCKALLPRVTRTPYRWGLTGSIAPNGYMDLFGQMKILDDGVALGRYITHYRDNYFSLGWDGFSYDLQPTGERRILERIAPYWFEMLEEDYAQLPELVDTPHMLEFEPAERKLYDRMKKDMIASLPEGIVTAANAAACYSKLSQMANGAVYVGDNKQKTSKIHDLKLDAVEDLLEELNGEPLLVAYEFNHDLERLRERFGVLDKETGKKVIPYLGKGTTAAQEAEWCRAWNAGELPLLCCHPASAGHGLNMQGASACNVAWFGITWDYELYDQFIRRIRRDGTLALQIFNHLLVVKDTIDELKYAALCGKEMTQSNLLRALNTEIRRSAETQAARASGATVQETTMMKLSRPGGATQETTQAATPAGDAKPAGKGWGGKAKTQEPESQPEPGQQERIAEQLEGKSEGARSAFTGGVSKLREQIQDEHGGEQAQETSNGVRTDAPDPAPVKEPRKTAEKASPVISDKLFKDMIEAIAGNRGVDHSPAIYSAGVAQAKATIVAALIPLVDSPEDLAPLAEALFEVAGLNAPF